MPPGVTGDDQDPSGSDRFAADLAELITDLQKIDRRGWTFNGQGRGGDLRDHDEWMGTCFRESERILDAPRLRRLRVPRPPELALRIR